VLVLRAQVLWNLGWWCMLAAVFREGDLAAMTSVDWVRAAFAVQMYATGFLTVVMTPMRGPDVAMGNDDALHCYGAIVYVADHFLANCRRHALFGYSSTASTRHGKKHGISSGWTSSWTVQSYRFRSIHVLLIAANTTSNGARCRPAATLAVCRARCGQARDAVSARENR
jgi:hypothetical protein